MFVSWGIRTMFIISDQVPIKGTSHLELYELSGAKVVFVLLVITN